MIIIFTFAVMALANYTKSKCCTLAKTDAMVRSNHFVVQPISVFGLGEQKSIPVRKVTIQTGRRTRTYTLHVRGRNSRGQIALDHNKIHQLIQRKIIHHNGLFISRQEI